MSLQSDLLHFFCYLFSLCVNVFSVHEDKLDIYCVERQRNRMCLMPPSKGIDNG